jgi:hypothetical protein
MTSELEVAMAYFKALTRNWQGELRNTTENTNCDMKRVHLIQK